MTRRFYIAAKSILLFGILILGCISCHNQPNEFLLKGTIENMEGNTILFVRDFPDSITIDTIKTDKDGFFSYRGSTDTLMLGTLFFNKGRNFTSVFFDKGDKIKIKGDANFPDLIEIKGNNVNDALSEFKKDNKKILTERAKLIHKFQNPQKKGKHIQHPPKPNPGMISKVSNLTFQLQGKASEYIKNNPENIASVILIQDFFKDNESIEQMNRKLQSLKGAAASFSLTNELKKHVSKIQASEIGEIAPNFFLKDKNDKKLRKGRYLDNHLILAFVSNEGPLALEQKKELANMHKEYKDKKVKILSVIVKENEKPKTKKTNKFEQPKDSIKTNWDVATLDEGWSSKILADYNVNELPLYVLIDPHGKIIAREESPETFKEKLPKD